MQDQFLKNLNQIFGADDDVDRHEPNDEASTSEAKSQRIVESTSRSSATKPVSFAFDIQTSTGSKALREGGRRERSASVIERNPLARKLCLQHYGYRCVVCGLDFGERFGNEFERVIDVHHINPLSEQKEGHVVDPVRDLVPLCPNCHRMIHSKASGVYSIEELREIVGRG